MRVLACTVALAATLPAQSIDHDITIGVRPGLLRYDIESFTVAPSSQVKLTLTNNDSMQHNLLVCRSGEGVARRVGLAAAKLGPTASDKQFVPASPDVLFHTRAILPGQSDTIRFEAPAEAGDYPYLCTLPGHMFTMVGVMHVGEPKPPVITELSYRVYSGEWKTLPDFDSLTPTAEGNLRKGVIDLAALGQDSDFGARFDGTLHVPSAGRYTFFLNSDDGSKLLVGGQEAIDYDGLHGMGRERTCELDLEAGEHSLRVDYFQRRGGLGLELAWAGPDQPRRDLSTRRNNGSQPIPIAVHHHPRVLRVHVEGAAARTIAVGLPGGMNYCFDAGRCSVQFGWAGAFLDVGPDRRGRGGQPCKTLGPRFEVGDLGFPLRTEKGQERDVQFLGYRTTGPAPRFEIEWDGTRMSWIIGTAPSGLGLHYTFEIPKARTALQFVIDPSNLIVASDAGVLRGGVLTVPAAKAKKFSVTLTPREGEDE